MRGCLGKVGGRPSIGEPSAAVKSGRRRKPRAEIEVFNIT